MSGKKVQQLQITELAKLSWIVSNGCLRCVHAGLA